MDRLRAGLHESAPDLRLYSAALWVAWITIFYSGDCVVVGLPEPYSTTSSAFLYSTLAIGITLVIAASFPKKATLILDSRAAKIGAAALAAAGSVGVGFAGAIPALLFYLAAIISGVATGMLALSAARLHAELGTRKAIVTACLTTIVGTLIYAFSTMCASYFSPGLVLAIEALLPAMGIWLASLGERAARPIQDDATLALSSSFWRITLFCGILVYVLNAVRAYYPQLIDTGVFSASRGIVAAGLIVCSAAVACLAAMQSKTSSFVRFFYLLLVLPVAAIAPIAFQGPGSHVSGAVGGVINGVVSTGAWALFAAISSRSGMSSVRVFGFGYGIIALAMTAGFVLGDVFGELISAQFTMLAGLLFLVLVVGIALLLVRERDLAACMAPTPAMLASVEALAGEDIDANETAQTDDEVAEVAEDIPRAGKFRQRCLAIAGEYGLSGRETDVFLLLARHKEAKAIADELYVSFNTVRTHIKNIYVKLDVHNRRELQELIDKAAQ